MDKFVAYIFVPSHLKIIESKSCFWKKAANLLFEICPPHYSTLRWHRLSVGITYVKLYANPVPISAFSNSWTVRFASAIYTPGCRHDSRIYLLGKRVVISSYWTPAIFHIWTCIYFTAPLVQTLSCDQRFGNPLRTRSDDSTSFRAGRWFDSSIQFGCSGLREYIAC